MRKSIAGFCVAVGAALAAVPAAVSAPGSDLVAGFGRYADGTTLVVAARSSADSTNPQGVLVFRTQATAGGPMTSYTGDVSQGCVKVVGNTAVVIGKLRASQQFNIPDATPQPFLIEYIGAAIVDNGRPVNGQPVDEAQPIFMRASSALAVCAGTRHIFMQDPLTQGDFVVHDALATP